MWEIERGKTFISVFHLSFCTRQANCLLTSGRCLSLHQLRKFRYSGLAAYPRLRNIWSTQAALGWGNCVCCIFSDPLLQSLSSLPHSYVQTQTDTVWLGHAVASPQCIRSSVYLESICLLPWTAPKMVHLLTTSLSVSFMSWGGEGPREKDLGDGEVGKKREGYVLQCPNGIVFRFLFS